MKNSKQIVEAIRQQKKHKEAGHSGGANGCPMCSRAAKSIVEEVLEEQPQPEQLEDAPTDPKAARLNKIFGAE